MTDQSDTIGAHMSGPSYESKQSTQADIQELLKRLIERTETYEKRERKHLQEIRELKAKLKEYGKES